MLKKLTDDQIDKLLHSAIREFGEKGYGRAKITSIAHAAGISAGVIYKYYEDKAALFKACVRLCTDYLDDVFSRVGTNASGIDDSMDQLIELAIIASEEHPEYFRLYHQITLTQDPEEALSLSSRIEGNTSQLYIKFLKTAQENGLVRKDIDPGYFAFFFDNIMMMINFSLSSQYYEERMKLYLGHVPGNDELKAQIIRFIKDALGTEEDR